MFVFFFLFFYFVCFLNNFHLLLLLVIFSICIYVFIYFFFYYYFLLTIDHSLYTFFIVINVGGEMRWFRKYPLSKSILAQHMNYENYLKADKIKDVHLVQFILFLCVSVKMWLHVVVLFFFVLFIRTTTAANKNKSCYFLLFFFFLLFSLNSQKF